MIEQDPQPQSTQKQVPRRKLIKKVRRTIKRENQRLVQTYQHVINGQTSKSALTAMLNPQPIDQNQYEMLNHISLGQTRKMKKRMKKFQKKFGDNPDLVFKNMQKYKEGLQRQQIKTIFNPVDMMEKRRQKRMRRLQANAKRSKNEVHHQKKVKNTNYKIVKPKQDKPKGKK